LYLLINGTVVLQQAMTVGQMYEKYKQEDQFLYILYMAEDTTG